METQRKYWDWKLYQTLHLIRTPSPSNIIITLLYPVNYWDNHGKGWGSGSISVGIINFIGLQRSDRLRVAIIAFANRDAIWQALSLSYRLDVLVYVLQYMFVWDILLED